jgi:hypothetical protein
MRFDVVGGDAHMPHFVWWAILTKPPTSKIRLIKISPHQNIALFDHDFIAGHTYQTANRLKSEGSTYGGSVYGGSTYGGSAQYSAQCSARHSALKTAY